MSLMQQTYMSLKHVAAATTFLTLLQERIWYHVSIFPHQRCAAMSPPNPTVAFSLWTDEKIILSLEDYNNHGKPLTHHLRSDLNPYSYLPSNLPDGIGYFLSSESEVKKDTQFGSWKANGEPSEIFTNSVLTGWRTTFEFFEGRFPNEKKTDWVMQEYKITTKGLDDGSKAKNYGSLCRILQNEECIPDQGINMIALPNSNSTGGEGSKSEAQKNGYVEAVSLTSAERRNCALRGDFLELDDLADPQSPIFSSFNSSCPTLASEEWFDPDMLFQERVDKRIDQKEQFKYTISGTVQPNEVVMRPATVGKLTTEEPMKSNCSLPALVVGGEKDGLVLECKQGIEAVLLQKMHLHLLVTIELLMKSERKRKVSLAR